MSFIKQNQTGMPRFMLEMYLFKINLSGENDEVRNLEGWMVKEVIQEFT